MTELPVGDSTLSFNRETQTMSISGSLRLANLAEYEPIKKMLAEGLSTGTSSQKHFHLRPLEFDLRQ